MDVEVGEGTNGFSIRRTIFTGASCNEVSVRSRICEMWEKDEAARPAG
jgi:hypothetical protein